MLSRNRRVGITPKVGEIFVRCTCPGLGEVCVEKKLLESLVLHVPSSNFKKPLFHIVRTCQCARLYGRVTGVRKRGRVQSVPFLFCFPLPEPCLSF